MRQALIVKNPKWEPFTAVSDAFKALSVKDKESAALVVRGRCKEKTTKTMKPLTSGKTAEWLKTQAKEVADKLKKSAAVIACLFAVTAAAQQNILPLLPAASIAGLTTNSTAGSGVLGWNIDQVAVFQLTVTGTNAGAATSLKVNVDTSDNGTYWKANAYAVECLPSGNATATQITRLTNSFGAKYIRFGSMANTNAATGGLSIPSFTVSLKEQ